MSVIKKVFKTMKKSVLMHKQLELKKQKTSFLGNLPKDGSRKKLELTIKSYSQRYIKYQ